jgi:hypothetical protein
MTTLKNIIRKYQVLAMLFFVSLMPGVGCTQDTLTTHTVSIALMPDVDYIKFTGNFEKIPDEFQMVGIQNGYSIYKTTSGTYFTVDPARGTMIYFTPGKPTKIIATDATSMKRKVKFTTIMFNPNQVPDNAVMVRIIGVDTKGNVIQENTEHKRFYLNPDTGEMVYVKY